MEDYRELFDLTGRVALVTGASEGIGRGIALGLARAGADLILASTASDFVTGHTLFVDGGWVAKG